MDLNGVYTAQILNLFSRAIHPGERDRNHYLTPQSIMYRLQSLWMFAALQPRETDSNSEWIEAPLNISHLRHSYSKTVTRCTMALVGIKCWYHRSSLF
jgi:hypothetical protein